MVKRCAGICQRELPLSAFRGRKQCCRSCVAGRHRFERLVAHRPWLKDVTGPARECMLAWETARLAFSRALGPWGIEVGWRGFVPSVVVRPGSRADPVPRLWGYGAQPHGEPAALPDSSPLAGL